MASCAFLVVVAIMVAFFHVFPFVSVLHDIEEFILSEQGTRTWQKRLRISTPFHSRLLFASSSLPNSLSLSL